jgi:Transposase IS4
MTPRKSQRNRKATVAFEDRNAASATFAPKLTSKTARNKPETALRPVAVEPLPELDNGPLPELPEYIPSLELRSLPSESIATGLSELETFKQQYTQEVVDIIVNATNSYADNARETMDEFGHARPWEPVNSTDIWRYIGCLIYMGLHIEKRREEYWADSHRLNGSLSLIRFEQIHRYFTLRDQSVDPRQEDESFAWPVDRVAAIIRRNFRTNWVPSSHTSIDVPQKVSQGPKTVNLKPTFALVIGLATRLRKEHPNRIFCLFLDNLFLNINISQALLALNICCIGTTQKNAIGFPKWFIRLKEHNRGLVWNSTLTAVVDSTLYMLWQDNNAVLIMTTAFRPNDTVEKLQKRPSLTSTNAHIVRPVFGDLHFKVLRIPRAIDAYNHHMGGVDRNNQLRANLTVHRAFETRVWRPLHYYMLDTTLVNSFLIWRGPTPNSDTEAHRKFQESVSKALRSTPYPSTTKRRYGNSIPTPNLAATAHNRVQLKARKHCVWCKEHAEEWVPKTRRVLGELVNEERIRKRIRQSKSQWGCDSCNVCLCQIGTCWEQYHSRSNNK